MISLYDILEAADGQLFGEPAAQIFTDLAVEAVHVQPGSLFVALRTSQVDGHQQIREAIDRGALGVVCMEPPGFETEDITVMIVRDPEQALMNWARIVMDKLGTTVIAVTGAAGKSTTKEAIARVLGMHYDVYNHPGSFSGRLGLPLALGKLSAQHDLAVLEFETDQPGEMAELVAITQPLVGVVTNVDHPTRDRTDGLDPIAAEMAALVQGLPESGLAILNYDDPQVRMMGGQLSTAVFSYGIDTFEADLLAYNIVVGRYKTGFDLRYGAERYVGRWTPLLGRHQIYAVLAAVAIGLSYQIPIEESLQILTEIDPLPGRLRPLTGKGGCLLVDDTFSASPQSARVALEWLRDAREHDGRRIFVLGDLEHPGDYAQRAHRQLGEQIVEVADLLVTQGNLAAVAGRAALDYGMKRGQVRMTYSHQDAAAVLRDAVSPHDVVLVKGSRATGIGEVVRLLLQEQSDAALVGLPDAGQDTVFLSQPAYPSWVEVDLSGTASNMRRLRELLGPDVAVMAMVPADAYGHGAVGIASTAVHNGASYVGVQSLAEAIALRDAGLEAPILIMGHISPWALRDAIRYDLTVSISSLHVARLANRFAAETRRTLRVHIHIDSGMGRLGLLPPQVMNFFRSLGNLRNIRIEGIFTELAAPDVDPAYTRDQLAVFEAHFKPLLASGMTIAYVHAANTAALLAHPESRYTMVRAGAILHGLSPSARVRLPDGFQPTLCWKTVIAQVRTLPRGSYIGSGLAYRTEAEERIGVIPVGYADGFAAAPYQWESVLVHGQRVPVVGHVGLNEATINLTDVPAVREGDEVVLIGRQRDAAITVEEVAGWLNTSVFEVLTTILPRVPRL